MVNDDETLGGVFSRHKGVLNPDSAAGVEVRRAGPPMPGNQPPRLPCLPHSHRALMQLGATASLGSSVSNQRIELLAKPSNRTLVNKICIVVERCRLSVNNR